MRSSNQWRQMRFGRLRRREFITLIGGAAVAWPLAAWAQQPVPTIGFLGAVSPAGFSPRLQAFHQGLKDTGYAEGANLAVEYRWADNQLDRLPDMAADLVRREVAVIVAGGGTVPAIAAKAATNTIRSCLRFPKTPSSWALSPASPGPAAT
jgi:putative ABC transport system substrate-binding protein